MRLFLIPIILKVNLSRKFIIMYSERVTEDFLQEHTDFHRAEGYPVTVFPFDGYEDGFFYDLLIKD